jgi:hypothetical protein
MILKEEMLFSMDFIMALKYAIRSAQENYMNWN